MANVSQKLLEWFYNLQNTLKEKYDIDTANKADMGRIGVFHAYTYVNKEDEDLNIPLDTKSGKFRAVGDNYKNENASIKVKTQSAFLPRNNTGNDYLNDYEKKDEETAGRMLADMGTFNVSRDEEGNYSIDTALDETFLEQIYKDSTEGRLFVNREGGNLSSYDYSSSYIWTDINENRPFLGSLAQIGIDELTTDELNSFLSNNPDLKDTPISGSKVAGRVIDQYGDSLKIVNGHRIVGNSNQFYQTVLGEMTDESVSERVFDAVFWGACKRGTVISRNELNFFTNQSLNGLSLNMYDGEKMENVCIVGEDGSLEPLYNMLEKSEYDKADAFSTMHEALEQGTVYFLDGIDKSTGEIYAYTFNKNGDGTFKKERLTNEGKAQELANMSEWNREKKAAAQKAKDNETAPDMQEQNDAVELSYEEYVGHVIDILRMDRGRARKTLSGYVEERNVTNEAILNEPLFAGFINKVVKQEYERGRLTGKFKEAKELAHEFNRREKSLTADNGFNSKVNVSDSYIDALTQVANNLELLKTDDINENQKTEILNALAKTTDDFTKLKQSDNPYFEEGDIKRILAGLPKVNEYADRITDPGLLQLIAPIKKIVGSADPEKRFPEGIVQPFMGKKIFEKRESVSLPVYGETMTIAMELKPAEGETVKLRQNGDYAGTVRFDDQKSGTNSKNIAAGHIAGFLNMQQLFEKTTAITVQTPSGSLKAAYIEDMGGYRANDSETTRSKFTDAVYNPLREKSALKAAANLQAFKFILSGNTDIDIKGVGFIDGEDGNIGNMYFTGNSRNDFLSSDFNHQNPLNGCEISVISTEMIDGIKALDEYDFITELENDGISRKEAVSAWNRAKALVEATEEGRIRKVGSIDWADINPEDCALKNGRNIFNTFAEGFKPAEISVQPEEIVISEIFRRPNDEAAFLDYGMNFLRNNSLLESQDGKSAVRESKELDDALASCRQEKEKQPENEENYEEILRKYNTLLEKANAFAKYYAEDEIATVFASTVINGATEMIAKTSNSLEQMRFEAREEIRNVKREIGREKFRNGEEAQNRIEGFTDEQQKRYELIKDNNRIISAVFPKRALTESEMALMAADTKIAERRARAQKMVDDTEKRQKIGERISKSVPDLRIPAQLQRAFYYFLDTAETPEAEKKNMELMYSLTTYEGQKVLTEKVLKKAITLKNDMFLAKDDDEFLDKAEKHFTDWQIGFVAFDVINANNFGITIDPELEQSYLSCHELAQSGGKLEAQLRYMAGPYYGTMPELDAGETVDLAGAFAKNRKRREALGLIPSVEGKVSRSDEHLGNYQIAVGGREIKEKDDALMRELIEKKEVTEELYKYRARDEKGNEINLSDAFTRRAKGEKITFTPIPKEEIEGLEKKLESLRDDIYDKDDWAKGYNETVDKLTDFYKELRNTLGCEALSPKYKGNAALLRTFVDAGENGYRSIPVMVNGQVDSIAAMDITEDDYYDEQYKDLLTIGPVERSIPLDKRIEVYKLAMAGKLFISAPGTPVGEARQIFIRKDGSIGLSDAIKNSERYLELSEKSGEVFKNEADRVMSHFSGRINVTEDNAERAALKKLTDSDMPKFGAGAVSNSSLIKQTEDFVLEANSAGLDEKTMRAEAEKRNRESASDEKIARVKNILDLDIGVRPEDEAVREKLSKQAFEAIWNFSVDKLETVDTMDRSYGYVRKMAAARGLKAVMLRTAGSRSANTNAIREANEEICRKFFDENANTVEKRHAVETRLKELTNPKNLEFRKKFTDAELVEKYHEYKSVLLPLTEIVKTVENGGFSNLGVDPKLIREAVHFYNALGDKFFLDSERMMVIADPTYMRVDETVFKNSIDKAYKVTNFGDDEYFGTAITQAAQMATSIVLAEETSLKAALAYELYPYDPNSEPVENVEIMVFDGDGKRIDLPEFGEVLKQLNSGKTLFAAKADGSKVIAFDNSSEFEVKDVSSKPENLDKCNKIKDIIETDRNLMGIKVDCTELFTELDETDRWYVRSSAEFAEIKAELKRVAGSNTFYGLNETTDSLTKIHNLAARYIDDKVKLENNGGAIDRARFDAVMKVYKYSSTKLSENYLSNQKKQFELADKAEEKKKQAEIDEKYKKEKGYDSAVYDKAKWVETRDKERQYRMTADMIDDIIRISGKKPPVYEKPSKEQIAERQNLQNRLIEKMKQKSEAPLKMPEMNDREKVETLYSIIAKIDTSEYVGKIPTDEYLVQHYDYVMAAANCFEMLDGMQKNGGEARIYIDPDLVKKVEEQKKYAHHFGIAKERLMRIGQPDYVNMPDNYSAMMPKEIKEILQTQMKGVYKNIDRKSADDFVAYMDTDKRIRSEETAVTAEMLCEAFGKKFVPGQPENETLKLVFSDKPGEIIALVPESLSWIKDKMATCSYIVYEDKNPGKYLEIPEGGYAKFTEKFGNMYARKPVFDDAGMLMSEKGYRENLGICYEELARKIYEADSIFVVSSDEYAEIRKELELGSNPNSLMKKYADEENRKLDEINAAEAFKKSADKIKELAETYVEAKQGRELSEFEQKRLNAVKDVLDNAKRISTEAGNRMTVMRLDGEMEKRLGEIKIRLNNAVAGNSRMITLMAVAVADENALRFGEGTPDENRKAIFNGLMTGKLTEELKARAETLADMYRENLTVRNSAKLEFEEDYKKTLKFVDEKCDVATITNIYDERVEAVGATCRELCEFGKNVAEVTNSKPVMNPGQNIITAMMLADAAEKGSKAKEELAEAEKAGKVIYRERMKMIAASFMYANAAGLSQAAGNGSDEKYPPTIISAIIKVSQKILKEKAVYEIPDFCTTMNDEVRVMLSDNKRLGELLKEDFVKKPEANNPRLNIEASACLIESVKNLALIKYPENRQVQNDLEIKAPEKNVLQKEELKNDELKRNSQNPLKMQ